jgi:hypothetical protein
MNYPHERLQGKTVKDRLLWLLLHSASEHRSSGPSRTQYP